MPVFVDPKSGERFANVPDSDVERAQKEFGLIPEGEYSARQASEQRPFLESAGEAVQATSNALLRPLEAAGGLLPESRQAAMNKRLADTYSPSSDDSRRIAQEHPFATAAPLLGEALLPGGALVQAAAGTLAGAAESTFQAGGEYGEVDPDELLTAAGMSVLPIAGAAAVGRLGKAGKALAEGVGEGARATGRKAGQKLAELGGTDIGARAGKFAKDEAIDYAVNAATGGMLPRRAREYAGDAIKKALGRKAVPEPVPGLGVQRWQQFDPEGLQLPGGGDVPELGATPVGRQRAGAYPPVREPVAPAVEPPRPPPDPESVAIGTGFSHIFEPLEMRVPGAQGTFGKSGREGVAWKGTPRQAASIDARIDAYKGRQEFLDLVAEKAAISRRQPFRAGHERELWELQKDVLEENPRLFPKVPYDAPESATLQRAKGILKRRREATGSVDLGDGGGSPVSLAGKSLKDLGALDDPSTFKPETLEALRTGKGGYRDFASDFGSSGRVNQAGQAEQGIQVELGPNGPRLVDGRHRLMVGREKGLTEVYGQVYQGSRARGKKVFEGMIPIAERDAGTLADDLADDFAGAEFDYRGAERQARREQATVPVEMHTNQPIVEYDDAMSPGRLARRREQGRLAALDRETAPLEPGKVDIGSASYRRQGRGVAESLGAGPELSPGEQALYERWRDIDPRAAERDPGFAALYRKLRIEEPTKHGPLFSGRGMSEEQLQDVLARRELDLGTHTSTSYRADIAENFASDSGAPREVVMRFEDVPEGAGFFRDNPQDEVVIKPGKYEVRGYNVGDNGKVELVIGRAQPARAASRAGERGAVSVGAGPNFTLGGLAKSPMGVVTALGGVGLGANVLARAERRANDAIDFDDLEDLPEADRREAIAANAPRYLSEASKGAASALEAKTAAAVEAKQASRETLRALAPEPSEAQRAFALDAVEQIEQAAQAMRQAGDDARADALVEAADALTEPAVGGQQGAPVNHDVGDVLEALDGAYGTLRTAGNLPGPAAAALEALTEGSQREDLWGDAAQFLKEMRAADAAADAHPVDEPSDQQEWFRALGDHVDAAREQADVLSHWGVQTEKLHEALDELQRAADRGEAVNAEIGAAGLDAADSSTDDWGGGVAGSVLGGAGAESGHDAGSVDAALVPGVRSMLAEQQQADRYDRALRSVERGAEVAIRRATIGAVGMGARSERESDATNEEFSEGYSDERAAFDARRETLSKLAAAPGQVIDALASSYGEMTRTHPEVYEQLVSMVTRAADILTQSMPASVQVSVAQRDGIPPSTEDIRSYARVYMAVTEPATYLADLGAGQAWPEQTQAFAAMYPEKWERLTADATRIAKERGPALGAQDATYLDITFGIGDALGGPWSDAGASAIRSAIDAQNQRNQQKAGRLPQSPAGAGIPTSATAALSSGPSATPVS